MSTASASNYSSSHADRRKKMVALAGVLALVLLANGILGLFALSYANEGHSASLASMEQSLLALETARSAQVSFKKQVQEWKNILLRGSNPEEYARYLAAFAREEGEIQAKLDQLAEIARKIGLRSTRIDQAGQSHTELGARYRAALGAAKSLDAVEAAAIDQQVRGIDRQPTDDMDGIVTEIQEFAAVLKAKAAQETGARYQALRRVSIASTAVGLIVVLVFLALSFAAEPRK